MDKKPIKQRFKSFAHAWNGLRILIDEETNARIHAIIAVFVIVIGFVWNIHRYEWLAVLGAMGLVLVAEIINTAIERLADHVTPEQHPQIKIIKDLAAGAVLLSAIIAIVVGLIVFGNKILSMLS